MMDIMLSSVILLSILLCLLAAGIWVGLSLLGVAAAAFLFYTDAPFGQILGTTFWGSTASWSLASLPLFIWMGEILFRSSLSEDMFEGLSPWLGKLPGGLLHTNVIGCGIFAAVSGSSAATAATIGRITIPELNRRGYPTGISIGSIAGAGTLGLLIPPSIVMIVYGVAANVSIGHLFIAGIGPGILIIILFSGYIALWALLHPQQVPLENTQMDWKLKFKALHKLAPVVILIIAVMSTIYLGIATPTEAAAFGVLGATALSALTGTFSKTSMLSSLGGAIRTTSMISLILAAAAVLSVAMGFIGIPKTLAEYIGASGLNQWQLIFAILILYIIMGCFLDGISMIVLTTAVLLPIVEAADINLIWFGIFIVICVEMSTITPPVGFNLFVIQGLTGEGIDTVSKAALPFFLLMVVAVLLITVFPEIALYLPYKMRN